MDRLMPSLGGEASVGATTVWLTPPYLLRSLGDFDLDPCAATNRPWDTAKNHYTKEDDGLSLEWFGRVWLNPPYGREMEPWLKRMAEYSGGGVRLSSLEQKLEFFRIMFFLMRRRCSLLGEELNFTGPMDRKALRLKLLRFWLHIRITTQKLL